MASEKKKCIVCNKLVSFIENGICLSCNASSITQLSNSIEGLSTKVILPEDIPYQSDTDFVELIDEDTNKPYLAFNHVRAKIKLPYKVRETIHKTVMVMGNSRAGKSQFIKNIRHPGSVAIDEVYSETKSSRSYSVSVDMGEVMMSIDFIDTPGFGEIGVDGAKSDELIRRDISAFIRRSTARIDLILVVLKNLTQQSVESIQSCVNVLGTKSSGIMYLLFTHFEGKNNVDEEQRIKDFHSHPKTTNIIDFIGNKILFTGCVQSIMKSNIELTKQFTQMQVDRNQKLLNTIKDIEQPLFLTEVVGASISMELSNNIIRELTQDRYRTLLEKLSNLKAESDKVLSECQRYCPIVDGKLEVKELSVTMADEEIKRLINIHNTAAEYLCREPPIIDVDKLKREIREDEKNADVLKFMNQTLLADIQDIEECTEQIAETFVVVKHYNERVLEMRKVHPEGNDINVKKKKKL